MWKRLLFFFYIEAWLGTGRAVDDQIPIWAMWQELVNSMGLAEAFFHGEIAPDANDAEKIRVWVLLNGCHFGECTEHSRYLLEHQL
jgi:hypothetical protein